MDALKNTRQRGCIMLCALVTVSTILAFLLILAVLYVRLDNAISERCYIVDATQHNVRPPIADASLYAPPILAFGRVCIDYEQRVAYWKISDGISDTVDVGSVSINGPLTAATSLDTAPVVVAMGVVRDDALRFTAKTQITRHLALAIIDDPETYYVAFYASETNVELARDMLGKTTLIGT